MMLFRSGILNDFAQVLILIVNVNQQINLQYMLCQNQTTIFVRKIKASFFYKILKEFFFSAYFILRQLKYLLVSQSIKKIIQKKSPNNNHKINIFIKEIFKVKTECCYQKKSIFICSGGENKHSLISFVLH